MKLWRIIKITKYKLTDMSLFHLLPDTNGKPYPNGYIDFNDIFDEEYMMMKNPKTGHLNNVLNEPF